MKLTIDLREFRKEDKLILIGESGKVVIQHLDGMIANRTDVAGRE